MAKVGIERNAEVTEGIVVGANTHAPAPEMEKRVENGGNLSCRSALYEYRMTPLHYSATTALSWSHIQLGHCGGALAAAQRPPHQISGWGIREQQWRSLGQITTV